ncbi:NAD(P)-binding protein [Xylariaceae sp. FL0804]|nr:NAD(P)-binding protein [Xylariaceae sp. FL0804]
MAHQISFDITPEKQASKLQFIRRQLFDAAPLLSQRDVDLSGKTAIVTGASGDIGLECSRQLLRLGLTKLIIAARDESKAVAARNSLLADFGIEPDRAIEIWSLDYASYESIVAVTRRAKQLTPRLDIVILAAGVNRAAFSLNPSTGHEEDIQTNYLSSVLLLLLFIGVFKEPASSAGPTRLEPGRIVLVTSDTAAWAKFRERNNKPLLASFDDKTVKYDKLERYGVSKLLGQLFLAELAKRVQPSLAIINCANPGLCSSGLQRELGASVTIPTRIIGRSPAVGARSLVDAAIKQDERSHGQYVEDGKLRPLAPFVYSQEAAAVTQRLWDETMQELSSAGAQDVLKGLT